MVRRTAKRRFRKVFVLLATVVVGIILIILAVSSLKSIIPLLSKRSADNANIIKPVGKMTEVEDLKKIFDEKNIIFESIKESSVSGVIIGKMKDGPLVYFSKNHDASWQASSLQLILSHLTIDNKRPSLIDLRRPKPIVKLE